MSAAATGGCVAMRGEVGGGGALVDVVDCAIAAPDVPISAAATRSFNVMTIYPVMVGSLTGASADRSANKALDSSNLIEVKQLVKGWLQLCRERP